MKWEKQVDNNITPFPKCWEDLGAGKSTHTRRLPPATHSCQWMSVSTKHIIKWQHGRLKKNTPSIQILDLVFSFNHFFSTYNEFLKTKSISVHGFLRMNLKKHFFQESFLDFPPFPFSDLFSQGFLSYLLCARLFGRKFTDIISNGGNSLVMQITAAPIYK